MRTTMEKPDVLATETKFLFREVMKEVGMPESRHEQTFQAIKELHYAFGAMDSHSIQRFFRIFKEPEVVRQGVFQMLAAFGIAENLRYEWEEDWQRTIKGEESGVKK